MIERNSCPKCGSDWIGEPIPEKDRETYFGGRSHFKREIAWIDSESEFQAATICPDCKTIFDLSWTEIGRHHVE